MNSLFNNLLQNYISHHHPSASNNNGSDNSILGSKPADWITNAAVFAGADALLNRYDEDHEKNNIHFWRNAGLAGALALGYQYWKNHHDQQQQQQQQQIQLNPEQAQQLVTASQQPQAPPPPQQPQALAYYYTQPQEMMMPYMSAPMPPPLFHPPQHLLLPGYTPSAPNISPYQQHINYPGYISGDFGLPFQNNPWYMLLQQPQNIYSGMTNTINPFASRPMPWLQPTAPGFPTYQQQQQPYMPFLNGNALIPNYHHPYSMY